MSLYSPVVENMKLDMRMNLKTKKARAPEARASTLPPPRATAAAYPYGATAGRLRGAPRRGRLPS